MRKISKSNKITLGAIVLVVTYTFLQMGHSVDVIKVNNDLLSFANLVDEVMSYFTVVVFKEPTAFFNTIKQENTMKFFIGSIFLNMFLLVQLSYKFYNKKNFKYKNIEHGSARWATTKEIKTVKDEVESNNTILSNIARMSLDGKKIRRNMNIIVFGGSGSGKTRFFLKPNLMQMNSSYVITDPKGEVLRDCGYMLKKAGYKVKVLDLVDIQSSYKYNPFHYLDEDKEEDVLTLITTLIMNTNDGRKGNDPFWESSEKLLLQAVFLYVLKIGTEKEKAISTVLKIISLINPEKEDGEQDVFDIMFNNYESDYGYDTTIKCYKAFKVAEGKTLSSILISVNARLSAFLLNKIADLTSKDELKLEKIGTEKTALFIITSPADTSFNFIASMLYTQLFKVLDYEANRKHEGSLPIPVRFLLDEFANIGKIPNFEKILAYARSLNIGIVPIYQSLGQLKEMYEKSWESIIDNCDTTLFLGAKGEGTTEYFSKMLGKVTIDTVNLNKSYSKSQSVSVNEAILGRELMTKDEIAAMPVNECLVFIKSLQPFKDKKYDIVEHQNYKYTFDYDMKNRFVYEVEEEEDNEEVREKEKLKEVNNYNYENAEDEYLDLINGGE